MDFFDNPKNMKHLKKVLDSWLDTPWRHKSGIKQKGCDCIHFVGCVMVETGVVQKFDVPDYPRDWHLHRSEEILYNEMKKHEAAGHCYEIELHDLKNGDIVLSRYGRTISHGGIFYGGQIYQAATNRKVNKKSIDQEKKLATAFRPQGGN